MADAPQHHAPAHADGGKKVAGIPRNYLIWGGAAAGAGVLLWWYLNRNKKKASSTTATVITGSTTTGALAALLKDWQQVPTSTSGSGTGSAGSGSSGGGGYYGGGYYPTSASGTTTGAKSTSTTSKTTSKTTTPPKTTAPKTSKATTPAKVKTTVTYSSYTVKAGQSLAEIAKANGISVAQLAHSNVYVPGEVAGNAKVGQTLGTGAGLKTGQVLKIPHYKTTG